MNTRIKVTREKLIEAIRERRAEAVAEHKRLVAAYPKAKAEWERGVAKALEEAARKVKAGDLSGVIDRYGDLRLPKLDGLVKPTAPPKEPETGHYDRSIATLSMSPDETISVTADDYARYVR